MEQLNFTQDASKTVIYNQIIPQISSLIGDEHDLIANLANVSAVLKEAFGFFWVGFYLVKDGQLVLGPFQGPVACTRIGYGKGVCGAAWQNRETILVPDVNAYDGHIACSSYSKSEIVIPLFKNNDVIAVLDIDSDKLDNFDKVDSLQLQRIVGIIEEKL